GLWVQAFDNSFSNMRICDARIGVRIDDSGNLFANIHPLCTYGLFKFYDETIGFLDFDGNNTYDRCYADQFSTGWFFSAKANHSVLHAPMCYWYNSTPGHPHTVFKCEGQFKALVSELWAGFRDDKATNAVLLVGEPGGHGYIRDIRGLKGPDSPCLNNPADAWQHYLQGGWHR
ncbi:MAG: hypothetical protein IJP66_00820, partial [Kiritimatiellae bacterium]|nr:hypothetical protein [Kiritimatiellia bacterium]